MSSFLNVSAFWLLPVLLLPICIHFFFRSKKKKVFFSDLRLLQKIVSKKNSFSRFKNIFLLVLRVLVFLFLIFAFAQPVQKTENNLFKKNSFLSSSDPISVVILMDSSLSMHQKFLGEKFFLQAQNQIHKFLNTLDSKDRSGFIQFSDSIESVSYLTSDHKKTLKALDQFQPSWKPTQIESAIQKALYWLSLTQSKNKVILIVSDLGFEKIDLSFKEKDVTIVFFNPISTKQKQNFSLNNLEVLLSEEKNNFKVQVEVQNYSLKEDFRAVTLEGSNLENLNQYKKIASSQIFLKAKEKKQIIIPFFSDKSLALKASLQEDILSQDNDFYAVLKKEKKLNILAIQQYDGLGLLSKSEQMLIDALVAKDFAHIDLVSFNQEIKKPLSSYDVVILLNLAEIEYSFAQKLLNFLKEGKGLFVVAGDRTQDGYAALSSVLPCGFGQMLRLYPSQITIDLDLFPLGNILNQYEWEKIKISELIEVFPRLGSLTLLKVQDYPLAVLDSKKQVLVMSGGFSQDSNLTLKPAFVFLLNQLVNQISLNIKNQGTIDQEVSKKFPRPGHYWQDSVHFIVNRKPNFFESNLESISLNSIKTDHKIIRLKNFEELIQLKKRTTNKHYSRIFLLLAILFLFLEGYFFKKQYAK